MRSLRILKDPIEMLALPSDRSALRKAIEAVKSTCQEEGAVPEKEWSRFQEWVKMTFPCMSEDWRQLLFQSLQTTIE